MLLSLLTAFLLCVAMAQMARGSLAGGGVTDFVGFDGLGVVAGFVAYTAAAAFFGPAVGFSLLFAFVLHEAGHVLAHRMIGHGQTRFRLVPAISRAPISDRAIKTEAEAFFVALMGPGLSLAPVVMAFALAEALAGIEPETARVLRIFACTCGALNFINLLPFWPLDGGRCARIAASNFWPALAPGLTVFMASAFASAFLRTGSLALLFLAAVGFQSLLWKNAPLQVRLGPSHALTALAAYAFTLAAHFTAAWTMFGPLF